MSAGRCRRSVLVVRLRAREFPRLQDGYPGAARILVLAVKPCRLWPRPMSQSRHPDGVEPQE